MTWAGDVGRIYIDGVLRADRFWDGSQWILDLDELKVNAESELILRILPLPREARIGLPADAEAWRGDHGKALHALDGIQLVEWFRWTEDAAS